MELSAFWRETTERAKLTTDNITKIATIEERNIFIILKE